LRGYIFRWAGRFEKRINLVYDDVNRYYHVINNLTGARLEGIYAKAVIKAVNVA